VVSGCAVASDPDGAYICRSWISFSTDGSAAQSTGAGDLERLPINKLLINRAGRIREIRSLGDPPTQEVPRLAFHGSTG